MHFVCLYKQDTCFGYSFEVHDRPTVGDKAAKIYNLG